METNKIFKQDAKSIVDTLFETKIFRDDLTRDELNTVEEMLDYLMSSRFDSIKRAEQLCSRISAKK
jgi:chemotaxis protein CheY-P-specific phosphatase CheC